MIQARRIAIFLILISMTVLAERTKLKPATSGPPQDDIKMGLAAAAEAEKQLVLIKNPDATAYITSLGNSLVAKAPNDNKFPFTFKIVDDKSINAFALPGGPLYVNRGAIEAADNEAQIAGVIGHEAGHVILRHGMAQAKKSQLTQGIIGGLGAIFGNSTVGQLAGAAGAFAGSSILLRYSRDAESQADLMGTQILFDAGYDPTAMAVFFDKLSKDHKGTGAEQFFSNHPIPENRVKKVNDEIMRIGAVPPNPRTDTADFQRVKKLLLAMPDPPKPAPAGAVASAAPPPAPSTRLTDFQTSGFQLRHPDNWKPAVDGTNVTLAPAGGVVGKGDLAYGLIIDVFKPQNAGSLDQATTQFMDNLLKGNPSAKIVRSRVAAQVGGKPAQLTELSNTSPMGGQESDVVITVLQPDGTLLYFIEVVPTKDMPQYQTSFRSILESVRFR
jgi:Zn-dependent protease with chaperone function